MWQIKPFASVAGMIEEAMDRLPRCLFRNERAEAFLNPESPSWCRDRGKPPFAPRSARSPGTAAK